MHTKISSGALRNIQEQQFCPVATLAALENDFSFSHQVGNLLTANFSPIG